MSLLIYNHSHIIDKTIETNLCSTACHYSQSFRAWEDLILLGQVLTGALVKSSINLKSDYLG
jgi:hypothetical protein